MRINEETLLMACVFPLPPIYRLIMLRVQLNLNTSEYNKRPGLINLKLLNLCNRQAHSGLVLGKVSSFLSSSLAPLPLVCFD